jgi:hypothetical protein
MRDEHRAGVDHQEGAKNSEAGIDLVCAQVTR